MSTRPGSVAVMVAMFLAGCVPAPRPSEARSTPTIALRQDIRSFRFDSLRALVLSRLEARMRDRSFNTCVSTDRMHTWTPAAVEPLPMPRADTTQAFRTIPIPNVCFGAVAPDSQR
ncbi:MAG: hypothetical protein ACREMA_17110 [Longimicrobiales bacterium]